MGADFIAPDTPVRDDEPLARFIVERRRIIWVSGANGDEPKLTERNFLPDRRGNVPEVSVFRILGLVREIVRELGQAEFGNKQKVPKPLLGWGQLAAGVLASDKLGLKLDTSVDPAYPSHPRHAGIRGWLPDGELTKAHDKSLAQELAARATAELVMTRAEIAALG